MDRQVVRIEDEAEATSPSALPAADEREAGPADQVVAQKTARAQIQARFGAGAEQARAAVQLKRELPATEAVTAYNAFVTGCSVLRLRKNPSMSEDTLAYLPEGTTLSVVGKAGGWLQVKADNNGKETLGYVGASYVTTQGEDDTIPVETRSYHLTDGPFGWDAKYDIWATQKKVHVRLRIKLSARAGVSADDLKKLKKEWEKAEKKWTGQYRLVEQGKPKNAYGVRVDVQFVDSGQHHDVDVRTGPATSNKGLWDTKDTRHAASHEIGHMLGRIDEYPDARSPGRTTTSSKSVMHTNEGKVQKEHYDDFASWLGTKTGKTFEVKK